MGYYEHEGKTIKIELEDTLYRMDYHLSGVKYVITSLPDEENGMRGKIKATDGDGMKSCEYSLYLGDIGYIVFLSPKAARRGYDRHDFRKDPMI